MNKLRKAERVNLSIILLYQHNILSLININQNLIIWHASYNLAPSFALAPCAKSYRFPISCRPSEHSLQLSVFDNLQRYSSTEVQELILMGDGIGLIQILSISS